MPKKIWRKNFEIKRIDYQMPWEVMEMFYNCQVDFLGKAYVKEGIWVFENLDNTGTYFLKDELRVLIEKILQKIIHEPTAADRLHRKTIRINRDYFHLAEKIEKLDRKKLSNKALIAWYQKIMALQQISHGISLPTTWFLDSDGEDFSRYLLNYLEGQIKKFKLKENAAEVFSILSTPLKDSTGRIEEKEMFEIINRIYQNRAAHKLFQQIKIENIKDGFGQLPAGIKNIILAHYKKWRWTPYAYIGPAYELDYYLQIIAGLVRQKIKPDKLLQEYQKICRNNQSRQRAFYAKLAIDKNWQHLFCIAQDIVFIKGFRKDCLYYGCYVRDMLLKEIAQRTGLSLLQARYFIPHEVPGVLLKKKNLMNELNARIKFSVIYMKNGHNQLFVGQKAKQFLTKQSFEKEKIAISGELKGMCACPGLAKGMVRIINLPEDMHKMKEGDIMIAHTTFPALVPAMKKAAAIVTEDGGITCHAAIVSRELKIPCVVGVRGVTKALRDGDLAEVDATRGVIKKLS